MIRFDINDMENKGEILLYPNEDGIVKIDVCLEGGGGLNEVPTCKDFLIVRFVDLEDEIKKLKPGKNNK
jgi:hypothetical protein